MRRWAIWLVLAAGVICTGIGIALLRLVPETASFGWTAYAPLNSDTYSSFSLMPWYVPASIAITVSGAGTTGATATALLLIHRSHKTAAARTPSRASRP